MKKILFYTLAIGGLVALGIKEFPAMRRELKIMKM
jgi:hypothetical protein